MKRLLICSVMLTIVLNSVFATTPWGWVQYTYMPSENGGQCHQCDGVSEDCSGFIYFQERIVGADWVAYGSWDNVEPWFYPNWYRERFCEDIFTFTVATQAEVDSTINCIATIMGTSTAQVLSWVSVTQQGTMYVLKGTTRQILPIIGLAICFYNLNMCSFFSCTPSAWDYYYCNHCAKHFIEVYPPNEIIVY